MNPFREDETVYESFRNTIIKSKIDKPYKLTPFIITLCEGELSTIDLKNFIEVGLTIIRFKMNFITKADKIAMLQMLKVAVEWCCAKYDVSTWPIAISIDLPNACIKTGFLKGEISETKINIHEDWIIEVTANPTDWNKCDARKIYIDDPYTIKNVPCGTIISLSFGNIVLVVIEVVNDLTLKCKVIHGGHMGCCEWVCIRGVKHARPSLSNIDLELIKFAKEFNLDIITVNSVRTPLTLKRIRKLFKGTAPLLISSICEQEGLDHFDEIIKESDGIILAREFLACEIENKYKMITIQMQLSAKCKAQGVPFYISGNILEHTLLSGNTDDCDIDDITNAVLQGAGFVMRHYNDPAHVTQAMMHIDEICKVVEPLARNKTEFWRMMEKCSMPVNAAEACILACVMLAKMCSAAAIIVPTVTGQTAIWVSQMLPEAVILTISTNPMVARKLQIYRGIIPIVYDKPSKLNRDEEVDERVKFAITYGIRCSILKYGSHYVTFKKSSPSSAFADNISSHIVMLMENRTRRVDYQSMFNLKTIN